MNNYIFLSYLYKLFYFQEVYRLNLEIGQFLAPYVTKANEINCCAVNEEHGLLMLGTESGHVEAWDPRTKSRQGILDCAMHCTDSEYRYVKLMLIKELWYLFLHYMN